MLLNDIRTWPTAIFKNIQQHSTHYIATITIVVKTHAPTNNKLVGSKTSTFNATLGQETLTTHTKRNDTYRGGRQTCQNN
eukprot:5783957-Lingulodinium_polyedra.AAC.1